MRSSASIIRAAVLSTTVSVWAMAAGAPVQYRLQHATSIDLSSEFFTAGSSGANPLSIAFDGVNAYVGGYNNTGGAATIGIVKVADVLTGSPALSALPNTQFSANSQRGLIAIDYEPTTASIYGAYDSGAAATSTITRWDTSGNPTWQVSNPEGVRPFALAIDPVGDAGAPAVGFLSQGQGRRLAVKTADGSSLYTISGGANPGAIITGSPSVGFAWRGMAFDSTGNIAIIEDADATAGIQYGVRVNANQFQTLAGTLNSTSTVIQKNAQSVNNVGMSVAILKGTGVGDLLAFQERTTDAGGTVTVTDLGGASSSFSQTRVQLRNLDGSLTDLTQTELSGDEDGVGQAFSGSLRSLAVAQDANGAPILLMVSFVERRLDVYNLEPTWTASGGGSWTTNSNWLVSKVPNSSLDNAVFGGAISSDSTVTLNGAKTVKNIKFNNANSYTIDGTDTITLNSAGTTSIRVLAGSHTIAAPVVALKDVTLEAAGATDALTLTKSLDATGVVMTKIGAGTVSAGSVRAALLDVQTGAMRITPKATPNDPAGTTVVGSLSLAGGPASPIVELDLSNNSAIIDVTGGIGSLVDDARQLLLAGSTGSFGIVSSSADATKRLGYGDNGLLGKAVFGGQTVDADSLLIKFTYAGDSNLDGQVDITDLAALATAWQTNGPWTSGDFNYDGFVDITDLAALATNWQAGVGAPLGQSLESALASVGLSGAIVPEPACGLLLAAAALTARRRR